MQNNKFLARHLISIVLSFILAIVTTASLCLITLELTIMNEGYMKSKITSSRFAEKAANELEENLISYGAASGFTSEAFTPLLNTQLLRDSVYKNVDKIYHASSGPNYEEIKKIAYDALIANVKTQEIEITKEIEEGVTQLSAICATDFIAAVDFPFINFISTAIINLKNTIRSFSFIVYAAFVFTVGFLFVLNKSHRLFRYYSYAFGSTFILTALPPTLILLSKKIEYISVMPISLNHFAVEYINGALNTLLIFSAAALILTAACIPVYFKLRKKKLKRNGR